MRDLDFAMRDISMLQVRREIRVSGKAHASHPLPIELRAQSGTLLLAVIEHRYVRTLGHEHYAVVAQLCGFGDEIGHTEKCLSPQACIADGMKSEFTCHRRQYTRCAIA